MHVVSFTGIQGYHKAVTGIHSVSLYQPGNVWCIEEGRDILFYFSGFDIGIQFQWLFIKERTDGNGDTFFVVLVFPASGWKHFSMAVKYSSCSFLPLCCAFRIMRDIGLVFRYPGWVSPKPQIIRLGNKYCGVAITALERTGIAFTRS